MRLFRATPVALSLCIVLSTLSFAAAPDRITRQIDSSQMVQLAKGVHYQARPEFDQGIVESSLQLSRVTLMTVPTPTQQAALNKLLADQQNPKSPQYHKWLTPEEYADRFGLSQNDIQRITNWIKSEGLSVAYVARGRNWIVFSGTAGQIQSALRTEIHRFSINGETHFANTTPASVPAALSGIVTGFRGLDDFRPRALGVRKVAPHTRPQFSDSNFEPPDLVAPGDIAKIYDIQPLYDAGIDGTGQKLVVVGQTDVYLADLQDFRSGFGLPAISNCTTSSGVITACSDPHFQYVLVPSSFSGGGDPGVSPGDLGESDLDLEWSGAVARGAQIIFVNSNNAFVSYYYAIDNNYAPVISLSYGVCELGNAQFMASDEAELQQGNSQGITIVNSSGDTGAAECDPNNTDPNGTLATGGLAVSYPASSPEVTGVGGTAISYPSGFASQYWGTSNGGDGGSALSYIPEIAWNDDTEFVAFCSANPSICSFTTAQQVQSQTQIGMSSSGGGPSNCFTTTNAGSTCSAGFPQPPYQANISIPSQTAVRFSPDVSFLATPNFPGYIFCTTIGELQGTNNTSSACANGISTAVDTYTSIIGGTSASAPVFAGIVTLMNQATGSAGFGNINSVLYPLAATPSNNVFHPVTTGTNVVYCQSGTPSAQPAAYRCPTSGTLSIGFDASNSDATTGYNLVTGLGSVDVNNLATALLPFTFTTNVNSASVVQGNSATFTFTITPDPTNGFNGTLGFSSSNCSGLPAEAICSFSPTSVMVSGTTPETVTLTIATTAPISEMRSPFARGGKMFYAMLLPGLLGICLVAGTRKTAAARGIQVLGLIMILGCSTLWVSSCGGSASNSNKDPGTPAGSYTVTVTASTAGANPISVPATVTLNVSAK